MPGRQQYVMNGCYCCSKSEAQSHPALQHKLNEFCYSIDATMLQISSEAEDQSLTTMLSLYSLVFIKVSSTRMLPLIRQQEETRSPE